MTKNDLKLIGSFIDNNGAKEDLNYAHLKEDGIYATNTRKAIHFSIPMLNLNMYLHKKILAGFEKIVAKEDRVTIDGYGNIRIDNFTKMSCDTFPDGRNDNNTNIKNIFNTEFKYQINLKDIDDIHFELTQKECYIDDVHLNSIIEYGGCNRYIIFYNKQTITDGTTNTGMAKIVGLIDTEEEADIVKFSAIVMGREFKTQANEQLLFDL